jgi:hypothetical protein
MRKTLLAAQILAIGIASLLRLAENDASFFAVLSLVFPKSYKKTAQKSHNFPIVYLPLSPGRIVALSEN